MLFVLTGPESSGKTTLAKKLAESFKFPIVLEYAREYLESNQGDYDLDDLIKIAKEQKNRIRVERQKASNVLTDTGALVMKVWAEEKYKQLPEFIKLWWEEEDVCYILCRPDLPWEADPLRENENNREELFETYYLYLQNRNKDFVVIEKDDRFQQAKAWIESKILE